MKLHFNNNVVEEFSIILSTRSQRHLGQIGAKHIKDMTFKKSFASMNEGSFTIVKEITDENGTHTEPLWDNIVDLKLVWVKELDEYFEIKVSLNEGEVTEKIITATSLCEAELSQTNLYNIEINTEIDIERDAYVITKFYNPNNIEGSFLHRILEKAPHYSIKYVDESLWNLQRTFSINDTSIYDFLTGECAEQFNCLFVFDTKDRSISVYDLYTVCEDCGHRGEFNDICPSCGSTKLRYLGEDTTILVSKENLTDEIRYETDVDSIKNCFRLEAGDDDMTAAIINCMPSGTPYLYYISQQQKQDMSPKLVDRLNKYDQLYEGYSEEYQVLMQQIYDYIDKILYYQSGMMPNVEIPEANASTEAAKLTALNLSPTAISSLNSSTSKATVESALKNIARVFINTGCVKLEIDKTDGFQSTYNYIGTDINNINNGIWTGRFKVTNYSDEEDIAYSEMLQVTINNDYETFLEQKVKKNISTDDEDGNVYDVLSIEDLDEFKKAIGQYCYNRLESFADAIQGAINVLIEECQGYEDAEYYDALYTPYYQKLLACQEAMNIRASIIKMYEREYEEASARCNTIHESLDFEKFLGSDLYYEFCLYRREDTYHNSNYISTGLDNTQLFQNALDFIEEAQKEIVKSGEHQHSISSDLNNLLVMKEFAPIVDYFELGNWIRFKVNNEIYRLRLISYEISFGSIQTLNTEFSTLTKTANGMNDIQSILKSAQSISTSYPSISKQAEQGSSAAGTVRDWVEEGLNSALVEIKNNEAEEVTYGKQGLLCREYDDITGTYSPEQLRLTHNILAFTKNNWQTAETALGLQTYKFFDANGILSTGREYGLNTKFVQAGQINGSQIIGGEIFSENYSPTPIDEKGTRIGTHINLNTGTMSCGGGVFKVDASGHITATSGNIGGWWISENSLTNGEPFTGTKDTNATGIGTLGWNWAFWAGNGRFSVTQDGHLYSESGTIAGWTLTPTAIVNNDTFLNEKNSNATGMGTHGADWAFWAGDGRFSVKQNGHLHAESGNIGGANISNNSIFAVNGENIIWSINGDGSATFNNVTISGSSSGNFSTGFGVSGVAQDQFDQLVANKVTANYIDATVGLTANFATIERLEVVEGKFNTLDADKITTGTLNTDRLNIEGIMNAINVSTQGLSVASLTCRGAFNYSGNTWVARTIDGITYLVSNTSVSEE